MSSLLVCAPALRPSVAFASLEKPALVLKHLSVVPKLAGVTPASRLEIKPAPQMVSSGIGEIDVLTGGLPRGCLSEICGPTSSGRTSALLAALAAATQRQEACALVDATDAFDPVSAAAARVDFERLLWVQCGVPNTKHNLEGHDFSRTKKAHSTEPALASEGNYKSLERALRVTDLLLQSGGFGLVAIDLGDVPFLTARRIPLTTWLFRFRRAVEHTPTMLFVVAQASCAQTCASLLVRLRSTGKKLSAFSSSLSGKKLPTHAQLLDEIRVEGELLRSRMERKPAGSVTAAFVTNAVRVS